MNNYSNSKCALCDRLGRINGFHNMEDHLMIKLSYDLLMSLPSEMITHLKLEMVKQQRFGIATILRETEKIAMESDKLLHHISTNPEPE